MEVYDVARSGYVAAPTSRRPLLGCFLDYPAPSLCPLSGGTYSSAPTWPQDF